jgi:hypothetical protein
MPEMSSGLLLSTLSPCGNLKRCSVGSDCEGIAGGWQFLSFPPAESMDGVLAFHKLRMTGG